VRLQATDSDPAIQRAEAELPVLEAEIERLTSAIIQVGLLDSPVEALKARQARADARDHARALLNGLDHRTCCAAGTGGRVGAR
jgi:hypothetical protein